MLVDCRLVKGKVDPRQYHASKGTRGEANFIMSPSQINLFGSVSPSKWVKGYTHKATKAKRWGNIIDSLSLTPESFMERYATKPETYPHAGKQRKWHLGAKFCKKWMAEREHMEILTCKESLDAGAAVTEIIAPKNGDDTIKRWFESSETQVMVEGYWKDEDTGLSIPVSALLDFVPKLETEFACCLGDLKTVASAEPQVFSRSAYRYGYHVQAAFDLDIYNAATGQSRDTWCFILSENVEPWESNRAMFGQEGEQGNPGFIELGRDAYKQILSRYCRCLKAGKWPSYNDTDEAVQGWCILRPEPFMAQKALFAPRYAFDNEEHEEPEQEPELDDVPTP